MKYGKEITEEIVKWLKAGNNQKDSAALAGISEETFYKWMKVHAEFSESIKKAEKHCKARNIAIILKAAEKNWQASAWYLERKFHNEYALKKVLEHVGDDNSPIRIKIVTDTMLANVDRLSDKELPETTSDIRSPRKVQDSG
jgi:hypothetical protein